MSPNSAYTSLSAMPRKITDTPEKPAPYPIPFKRPTVLPELSPLPPAKISLRPTSLWRTFVNLHESSLFLSTTETFAKHEMKL